MVYEYMFENGCCVTTNVIGFVKIPIIAMRSKHLILTKLCKSFYTTIIIIRFFSKQKKIAASHVCVC